MHGSEVQAYLQYLKEEYLTEYNNHFVKAHGLDHYALGYPYSLSLHKLGSVRLLPRP